MADKPVLVGLQKGPQIVNTQDDGVNVESTGQGPSPPIGFTGLFFSTFFGGHDPDWASPRDQYVWFSSFAMRIND